MSTAKHPLIGQYVVIEADQLGPHNAARGEVKGTFRTMGTAEKWMLEDAVNTFEGSDRSLQNGNAEEWGSDMFVCEVKRVCRPVPVVNITARIMDTPAKENAVFHGRKPAQGGPNE